MKKVLIVGLKNYQNLGDRLLVDTTEYICKSLGYDTVSVDFRADKKEHPIRYLTYGVVAKLSRLFGSTRLADKLKIFAWGIRNGKHIRKHLKNVGAVIIACGNLMYSSHVINCVYETVIKETSKKKIPVMLSAMSVEKANENSYKFNRLKKYLSRENVKFFTTRDGKVGLEKFKPYDAKGIDCDFVADAAYWISESLNKTKSATGVVGVNVISGYITPKYSEGISQEVLRKYYIDLFKLLDERNVNYQVFTTGMVEDEAYVDSLLEGLEIKGKRVPQAQTVSELFDIISGCSMVYGGRMHSCIISHILEIPVSGFIWDDKLRNYSKISGQEKCFLTKESLDAKTAYNLLNSQIPLSVDYEIMGKLKQKTKDCIEKFLNDNFQA